MTFIKKNHNNNNKPPRLNRLKHTEMTAEEEAMQKEYTSTTIRPSNAI